VVPPPEGETVRCRADKLDGDTVILVLAGDTGEFLDSGVVVPPPEGETVRCRADKLDGDAVILVLAGHTGELGGGVEVPPSEGETAGYRGVRGDTSKKLSSREVTVSMHDGLFPSK